jgi:hypothetical protein
VNDQPIDFEGHFLLPFPDPDPHSVKVYTAHECKQLHRAMHVTLGANFMTTRCRVWQFSLPAQVRRILFGGVR